MLFSARRLFSSALALAFAATLSYPAALQAQATNYEKAPPVLLGAAWYPEQWPESQWEPDLARMEAAHITFVRVGEFAWSTMEPSEGDWQWGWLDRAIAAAAKHHIYVVLGTPTAAPPAWLTEKYPQTLRVSNEGVRDEHGNRQQFSFDDAKYRELAKDVATRMAERYGHNPDVVAWQIDNELANPSFDDEAKQQFHAWLKAKYGTIADLNKRWWTSYWSQTYNSFDQVPVHEKGENPALLLDWKRFVTDTWVSYTQNQVEAIRAHADARQKITTNTMGWFDGFNAYKEHEGLDFAAWDDYIASDHFDWAGNGAAHDLTRGYKQKNFWVMETEPAFVNWRKINTPLNKGQVREMAWQAIAHGSDAVEYWQWRAALNGQEEYHGVLVGADSKPAPVYAEVQQIGKEFDEAGKALSGTTPVADVALINDFDSRWAIDFQRHNQEFDPVGEMIAFYRPLHEGAQGVDVISDHAPLDKYKLVVAPGLNVLPTEVGAQLLAYVKQGGHLLLGPRSGMKNYDDGLNPEQQPGPLAEALGAHVSQFYAIDEPTPLTFDGAAATANIWAETLTTDKPDAKVIATYGDSNGWLDGQPAAVTTKVGKGTITYLGAWLDDAALKKLTDSLLEASDVPPMLANVPESVEVNVREGKGHAVVILINHGTEPTTVTVPSSLEAKSLLSGTEMSGGSVTLPKYGVAVLETKSIKMQ
jgi:beta-galactosidase